MKKLAFVALALAASSALAQTKTVTVGSKIDTEGALLCAMSKALLEQSGFTVKDRCSTGTTPIVRKALLEGEIDLYPEYTGNIVYLLPDQKIDPAVALNASKVYSTARTLDKKINNVVWLRPASANNTWAIAVPQKLATAEKLRTIADLAKYINAGKTFKLAASQEFVDRDDALKGFEKAYGFKVKPDQLVILPGGNTTQTITAAAQGTSGVNAGMAYGTDGAIGALGMVSLTDPKGGVAVYQPAITVRGQTLEKYPEIKTVLEPVFAKLNQKTLADLNGKIAVGGQSAAKVAGDWLKANNFLK